MNNPFEGLLSFKEATDLWGLNESTLRKAVTYGKLKENIDVKKFGKQWIITQEAMEREYGPMPGEDKKYSNTKAACPKGQAAVVFKESSKTQNQGGVPLIFPFSSVYSISQVQYDIL